MNNSNYLRAARARQQEGAALLLALVILTLIMLVGVASLQQSVLQSRIVFNTNAAGIAFQAADTAVEHVMRNPTNALQALAENEEVSSCVGRMVEGVCAPLNGPAQVRASSVARRSADVSDVPITGSSTNTNVWRFYEVTGTGSLGVNAFAQVSNTQEFARAEIAMSNDIFDEKGGGSVEVSAE